MASVFVKDFHIMERLKEKFIQGQCERKFRRIPANLSPNGNVRQII